MSLLLLVLLLLAFLMLLAFLLLPHRFPAVAGITTACIITAPTCLPDVAGIPAVVGTSHVVGTPRAAVCIPAGIPPVVGFPAVFGVLYFSKTNMSGLECGTDHFFGCYRTFGLSIIEYRNKETILSY